VVKKKKRNGPLGGNNGKRRNKSHRSHPRRRGGETNSSEKITITVTTQRKNVKFHTKCDAGKRPRGVNVVVMGVFLLKDERAKNSEKNLVRAGAHHNMEQKLTADPKT